MRRRGRRPDLAARVGSLELRAPVMTAAGTAGHGAELSAYLDLSELGAVVVKSLAWYPWPGNPAPRVAPAACGMLNSVGLQGPGIPAWLAGQLPALAATGASVVASIWGRSVEDYARAAEMLLAAPGCVVAVEVNLSCPNLDDGREMFARSAEATAAAVAAATACGRPVWAKLSPGVGQLAEVAGAALAAGAEALTLVNTLPATAIDPRSGEPVLGAGSGGLSGPALRPVAVKAIGECRAAHPAAGIAGAGGVFTGRDAAEMLAAGADAVQVGTATFLDPRAPARVLGGLRRWCERNGVERLEQLGGRGGRGAPGAGR